MQTNKVESKISKGSCNHDKQVKESQTATQPNKQTMKQSKHTHTNKQTNKTEKKQSQTIRQNVKQPHNQTGKHWNK